MRSCFVVVCLLVLSFGEQMLVAQKLRWEPSLIRFDCSINLFATNGQTLYASVSSAGASDNLYRSDDSGKTWRGQLNNSGFLSINVITSFGSDVFVSANGLFCTGNNCSPSLVSARINAVAAIGNILFIGTGTSGVLRRNNSGWSPFNVGLTPNISVLTTSGSILYAGSPLGVYRTLDSGLTWSAINRGLTDTRVQAIAANSSFVFAATEGGIFRSQDSGTTWMAVNTGLTERNVKAVIIGDGAVFLATSTGTVFRSTDNGVNWSRAPFSFQGSPVLSFGKLQNMIFAGTREAGIFRSADNGVTWQCLGNGLPQRGFFGMVSSGASLLLSRGNALYSSEDSGKVWKNYASMPDGANIVLSLGKVHYARRYGLLYESDSSDKIWRQKSDMISVVHAPPHLLFSSSSRAIFRSLDSGKTLEFISSSRVISANLITVPNSRILFALSPQDSNSTRSTDNGLTWSNFNSARFFPYSFVRQGASIFAGTSLGLQRSDDDGATWRVMQFRDTAMNLTQYGATMYATVSGRRGFLLSNDNGASWTNDDTGLSDVFVHWLSIKNGIIFASTSLGLFQATLSATITSAASLVSLVSRSSPSNLNSIVFSPNPATNQTTLQLDLASTTPVTMLLYNTLGQCVLLRELGTLPQGAHDIVQDMSNIPRGAYTLVVQTGSERFARQLRVMP